MFTWCTIGNFSEPVQDDKGNSESMMEYVMGESITDSLIILGVYDIQDGQENQWVYYKRTDLHRDLQKPS